VPIPTPPPAPTSTITYINGIFINEILPSPEGADETNEWIELYNSNNVEFDLQGWKIQDIEGTTTDYTFPKDIKIAAFGYLVFKRPETKIILNNEKDGLNLIAPDGTIKNSMSFENAPKNQSYNLTSSGWQWSNSLTPNSANIIITATVPKNLSKDKKSDSSKAVASLQDAIQPVIQNATNDLSEPKTFNPWFLFLIAMGITIICATIVLIIKFKFSKTDVRP